MNVAPELGNLTTFLVTSAFHLTSVCRGNMSHLAAFRITTVFISNAEYGIDLKRDS